MGGSRRQNSRLQRVLPRVLLATALLLLMASLAYIAIRGRQAAIREQRFQAMKSIAVAFSPYNDTYRRLPASVYRDRSGRPLCSWRFEIMTFVAKDSLGRFPQEYWLDPVNFESVAVQNYAFTFARSGKADSHAANVSLVTGPGTPFDGQWWSLEDLDPDTILIVEVAGFDHHWMEPGDLEIDEISPTLTSGPEGKGFHVGFADKQVWFLDARVPLADLKPFFTIDGAKQFRREEKLGPYRWK